MLGVRAPLESESRELETVPLVMEVEEEQYWMKLVVEVVVPLEVEEEQYCMKLVVAVSRKHILVHALY